MFLDFERSVAFCYQIGEFGAMLVFAVLVLLVGFVCLSVVSFIFRTFVFLVLDAMLFAMILYVLV